MTTQDYIKELKNYLSDLENAKKKDIVKEIESYIEERHVDYSVLVERFGTPKELAESYLEGMPIKERKGKKIWSKTKKVIFTIIIFLAIVFIIIGIFVYNVTKDPFDYSQFTSKTINEKVEAPWVKLENINSISIDQSRVVIYWTEDEVLQASCQGNLNDKKENTFRIKQSECFLKIPKQKINIKSYQAKVILVKPENEVTFDSEQSRIKIAQKNNDYKYDLNGQLSDFENFSSKENGILIKGTFYQSKVTPYEY